jgi:hypothetical protein
VPHAIVALALRGDPVGDPREPTPTLRIAIAIARIVLFVAGQSTGASGARCGRKEDQSMSTLNANKADAKFVKRVEESLKLLEKAVIILGDEPAMTVTERRRSLKLRKGGEKFIPTIVALCTRHGLRLPAYPLDVMTMQMDEASSLVPLQKQAHELLARIEGAIARRHAGGWTTATMMYSMLRRLGNNDGTVAETLSPMEAFFAKPRGNAKRSKKPATPDAKAPAADVSTPAVPTGHA